ncbi:MAG: sugar phosphate isomerase/epimerase [Bacteroidetes bacterium]|nr:sugar phosphate isomerase/epimerase [Bacteroidota bacterium]MBS1649039.1 sugar phosphate isomerase/epimerase [Bacteroidota bacterium]
MPLKTISSNELNINQKINIKYICPFWGQEHAEANIFINNVIENNFQGIEIHLPESKIFIDSFIKRINDVYNKNIDFAFIPQQLTNPENEKVEVYIKKVKNKLLELTTYQPTFINSHTGKDYYSFDDNCRVIEACMNISSKTGVKILHETHRGRFSFHTTSLIPYLEKFPEIELTGDFSHFCTVSESLLNDQQHFLEKIIPHISYIHARIGHEQAPQVNDPFAPEWKNHLAQFKQWWNKILVHNIKQGKKDFMICTEFGPTPYMPCLPYTQQPVSNQWQTNIKMKKYLQENFKEITS